MRAAARARRRLPHGAHGAPLHGGRGSRRIRRRPGGGLLRQLHHGDQELERRLRDLLERHQDLRRPAAAPHPVHPRPEPRPLRSRAAAGQARDLEPRLLPAPPGHLAGGADRRRGGAPRRAGAGAPRVHRGGAGRGGLHRVHGRHHRLRGKKRCARVHHRDGARRAARARAPLRRHGQALLLHQDGAHLHQHGHDHAGQGGCLPGDGRERGRGAPRHGSRGAGEGHARSDAYLCL